MIDKMSINEKIGQMLIVGMDGNKVNDRIKNLIEKYKISGVILYKKNYNNYNEMIEIIKELKVLNSKNKVPLFIAIDQEGGRVNRMPNEFYNLKSPKKIVQQKDIKLLKDSINVTSKMLLKTGINMNIAPVLDIQRFKDNHPIGDRCYGKNKKDVCKYGVEAMKQMQNNNLISVIKHFPGHGATQADSHHRLPIVSRKINKLENDDIIPFKKAIKDGADCIMVGHLIIKDVDKLFPVSLSKKIIKKYLREKENYDGVIITDDIKMQAISFFYGVERATKRALTVGNDVIMIKAGYKKEKCIMHSILKNKKLLNIIDKKVERILRLKEKYNINDISTQGCNIEEINNLIQEINNKLNL